MIRVFDEKMSFVRILLGTINQSNVEFEDRAGKQCTCCCLYAIAFTKFFKTVEYLNADDIDFISVLQAICELKPTTLTFCDPEIAAMLEDMPNFVEMTKFDQIEIEDPEDE